MDLVAEPLVSGQSNSWMMARDSINSEGHPQFPDVYKGSGFKEKVL